MATNSVILTSREKNERSWIASINGKKFKKNYQEKIMKEGPSRAINPNSKKSSSDLP